jgi:membrane protein YdbS with pleckstrin-like domain
MMVMVLLLLRHRRLGRVPEVPRPNAISRCQRNRGLTGACVAFLIIIIVAAPMVASSGKPAAAAVAVVAPLAVVVVTSLLFLAPLVARRFKWV